MQAIQASDDLVARKRGPGLGWKLRNMTRPNYIKTAIGWHFIVPLANKFGIMTTMGQVRAVLHRADGSVIDYGVLGRAVITTAWAEFFVDQLQAESTVIGDLKFHDSGIGITAAVIGDTDIETTDAESRATGTQVESTSVIYESVGTIAYTSGLAITEHGIFTASTGVTLCDRTVFAAINVVNGDSIQFTYDYTVATGG